MIWIEEQISQHEVLGQTFEVEGFDSSADEFSVRYQAQRGNFRGPEILYYCQGMFDVDAYIIVGAFPDTDIVKATMALMERIHAPERATI